MPVTGRLFLSFIPSFTHSYGIELQRGCLKSCVDIDCHHCCRCGHSHRCHLPVVFLFVTQMQAFKQANRMWKSGKCQRDTNKCNFETCKFKQFTSEAMLWMAIAILSSWYSGFQSFKKWVSVLRHEEKKKEPSPCMTRFDLWLEYVRGGGCAFLPTIPFWWFAMKFVFLIFAFSKQDELSDSRSRPFADSRFKERLFAIAFVGVFLGVIILELIGLNQYPSEWKVNFVSSGTSRPEIVVSRL